MACEHHVIGLKLEAGSELVYVTSIWCDNATVLYCLSLQTRIQKLRGGGTVSGGQIKVLQLQTDEADSKEVGCASEL